MANNSTTWVDDIDEWTEIRAVVWCLLHDIIECTYLDPTDQVVELIAYFKALTPATPKRRVVARLREFDYRNISDWDGDLHRVITKAADILDT